jgi:phage baseplate assembly protein V
MKDLIRAINNQLAPLTKRIKLVVGRCVLDSVKDSTGLQNLKIVIMADEVLDKIERVQEYGFTSYPLAGCEGVAVFTGGNRDNGVVIATDDRRYRPSDLAEGDTCLYNAYGTRVILKNADGSVEVITDSELKVNAPLVNILSDEINLGNGTLEKLIKGETFQTYFNTHTHTGNLGAPTSPPITPSDASHLTTITKGT